MSHYEICIHVHLSPVNGQPAGCALNSHAQPGDAVLYGILPDQAAADEVMTRLYELGIDLVLANVHSERVSHFARELRPECVHLN